MIINEKAIDTLFGGVTLVLICMICSINLLILTYALDKSDTIPSIKDNELNYILGSEICVSRNLGMKMILQDYILYICHMDESETINLLDNSSTIQQKIRSLIDFYFSSVQYWVLSANISNEEMIIANSLKNIPENFETIIQYRVIGSKSDITDISLTLYR